MKCTSILVVVLLTLAPFGAAIDSPQSHLAHLDRRINADACPVCQDSNARLLQNGSDRELDLLGGLFDLAMGVIGQVVNDIVEDFASSLGISLNLDQILPVLMGLYNAWQEITASMDSVRGDVAPELQSVFDLLYSVLSTFQGTLETIISTLATLAGSIVEIPFAFVVSIVSFAEDLMLGVVNFITALFTGTASERSGAIQVLRDFLGPDNILSGPLGFLQSLGGTDKVLADNIDEGISKCKGIVDEFVEEDVADVEVYVRQGISFLFAPILDPIVMAVSQMTLFVVTTMKLTIDTATGAFSTALSGVSSFFQGTLEASADILLSLSPFAGILSPEAANSFDMLSNMLLQQSDLLNAYIDCSFGVSTCTLADQDVVCMTDRMLCYTNEGL